MIFFRVTHNINIKTTDGILVNYFRFKAPASIENETVYITTYDDFIDLKQIFAKIDKNKYVPKMLNESNVRLNKNFPIELGISSKFEFNLERNEREEEFIDLNPVDIYKQLRYKDKSEIKLVIIGGVGKSISHIVASCTALRILHAKLKELYREVKMDVYINASNNSYFTRDKDIYKTQDYINEVLPLSINTKKICEYDYYIDNSIDFTKLLDLNYVDAWLFKFGIDYKKIKDEEKYNYLNTAHFKTENSLKNKIADARKKGKLLLFHPYSANIEKSVPQAFASEYLKDLLVKYDEYIIVTTLQIDPKIKADNILDLTAYSRSINDFIYIVSCMDEIITTDTSTLHISDAFLIPTIAIFTDKKYEKKVKYYKYVKPIYMKDKSKNLSKFNFENDALTIYKFEAWKELNVDKIIKLLDKF